MEEDRDADADARRRVAADDEERPILNMLDKPILFQ
jgi:hypothetical protein